EYGLRPVAVRGGSPRQVAAAVAAGFFYTPSLLQQKTLASPPPSVHCDHKPPAPVPSPPLRALVIDKPVRCGQQVYARGRDLVVMATVNAGAELISDGHIHVYAPLRGKAFAGATGDTTARVFALSMASQMIGIAGIYDTSDRPVHESFRGRPAQISLVAGPHGNRLVVDEISC
ncbi:septum site-determining protein MinC, partial [Hydrogenophaga sp.]|uniref:septum site-determining protein MinC n=1 Tax=Hydrogenophaga sp. TaxID=1904254 RepID=UPI003AF889CC